MVWASWPVGWAQLAPCGIPVLPLSGWQATELQTLPPRVAVRMGDPQECPA